MAFLLWFHVATEKVYDVDVRYRLRYTGLADNLILAAPPPDEVAVVCRGSGKNLLPLLFKERDWPIDLSAYGEGLAEITLDARDAPRYDAGEVVFSGIAHEALLQLHIAERQQKTVPVVTANVYQTREGYVRAGPEIISPDSVVLSGPSIVLENINRVLPRPHTFSGLDGPVDTRIDIIPLAGYNVTSSAEDCRVVADVQPYATRTFEFIPVNLIGRSDDSTIQVNPETVSVTVGGAKRLLGKLKPENIRVHLDNTAIDSLPVRLPLIVNVPDEFRAVRVQPASVLIESP